MSTTLTQFSSSAVDLADGDVIRAFLALATHLADFGTVRLRACRFGLEAFAGDAGDDVVPHLFASDTSLEELRVITLLELRFGANLDDPIIKFERGSSNLHKPTLVVDSERFRSLESRQRAEQDAVNRIANDPNQGDRHQRQQKEQERGQAQARLDASKKEFESEAPELLRRVLRGVNACHKAGLVRPTAADEPPAADGSTRFADEVAALRATIASQQRNAAEVARAQADDYSARCESLRREQEERTQRLEAEFAQRQQRVEEDIRAREVAAQTKLDEVTARETRLELNDEKAERRRLRRELQDATKARAEKPDLSSDAKNSFARNRSGRVIAGVRNHTGAGIDVRSRS